jgi:N-acetylmuramoyl-L-alanine amidase
MGFINNPDDERQLSDSAHRKRLMNAVGDAVDAWFARQAKVAGR